MDLKDRRGIKIKRGTSFAFLRLAKRMIENKKSRHRYVCRLNIHLYSRSRLFAYGPIFNNVCKKCKRGGPRALHAKIERFH